MNNKRSLLLFVLAIVIGCAAVIVSIVFSSYDNSPTFTPSPIDTFISTPSITFTLPPTFDAKTTIATFCHLGPDEGLRGATPLSANAEVEILAMSETGDWFMIREKDGSGSPCWVKRGDLTLSNAFDPGRVQVFTTIVTKEDMPCLIFPELSSTIQTIIPVERRIAVYGKSDLTAKWLLVVPHDSTIFCWVENKTSFTYPTLIVESADIAYTATPTSTKPPVVVIVPATKKPTKDSSDPPPATPNPAASNTPIPPTNTEPPPPPPTDPPTPEPTATLCWPPGHCK